LVKWDDEPEDGGALEGGDTGMGGLGDDGGDAKFGDWDQFRTNQDLFGIDSEFDEQLYTTKLDHNDFSQEEWRKADRLAKEIESGGGFGGGNDMIHRHMMEERNQIDLQDNDMDEEDLYSTVIPEGKQGFNNNFNNKRNSKNAGPGVLVQRGSGLPNHSTTQNQTQSLPVQAPPTKRVPLGKPRETSEPFIPTNLVQAKAKNDAAEKTLHNNFISQSKATPLAGKTELVDGKPVKPDAAALAKKREKPRR
jgi:hypothetical protein